MTITFTTETIRLLTLFENVTNVPIRDCFMNNDVIYYIVEEGKILQNVSLGGMVQSIIQGLLGFGTN